MSHKGCKKATVLAEKTEGFQILLYFKELLGLSKFVQLLTCLDNGKSLIIDRRDHSLLSQEIKYERPLSSGTMAPLLSNLLSLSILPPFAVKERDKGIRFQSPYQFQIDFW